MAKVLRWEISRSAAAGTVHFGDEFVKARRCYLEVASFATLPRRHLPLLRFPKRELGIKSLCLVNRESWNSLLQIGSGSPFRGKVSLLHSSQNAMFFVLPVDG